MGAHHSLRLVGFLSAILLLVTFSSVYFARVAGEGSFPSQAGEKDPGTAKGQDRGKTKDNSHNKATGEADAPIYSGTGVGGSSNGHSSGGRTSNAGSTSGGSTNDGSSGDEEDPSASAPLTVTLGDIELLYPGKVRAVPLTIGNPFSFDILVNRVTVTGEGTELCPASFLNVGSYDIAGPLIMGKTSGTATTEISLKSTAPDECQGQLFTIHVLVEAGRL